MPRPIYSPAVIHVNHITKRYGGVTALQELTLEVPAGSIFGLLGPNGAGKTTLLRLITGSIFADRGRIDLACSPHQLGYLPERPHFPRHFRVREYLLVTGAASGMSGRALTRAVDSVIELAGLGAAASGRIAACSKGMLQRVGVAQALLGNPPLILLDEPFSGLDPAAQAAMRYLLQGLSQSGKTILLSTHGLEDITQIATHIAILARGRLAYSGRLPEALAPRSQIIIRVDQIPEPVAWQLQSLHPEVAVNGSEVVLTGAAVQVKAEALRLLLDAQVDVLGVDQRRATLEEIYLEAVG